MAPSSASSSGPSSGWVFRRDACGIICLMMTYGAVLYADYVVVRWIVLQVRKEKSLNRKHVMHDLV